MICASGERWVWACFFTSVSHSCHRLCVSVCVSVCVAFRTFQWLLDRPAVRPAAPCRDSSSKCDLTQHLASFMPEWVVSTSACIALMAVMSHHRVNHVQDDGEADDLLRRVQSVAALLHCPGHSSLVLILMHDTFSILQHVLRMKTEAGPPLCV